MDEGALADAITVLVFGEVAETTKPFAEAKEADSQAVIVASFPAATEILGHGQDEEVLALPTEEGGLQRPATPKGLHGREEIVPTAKEESIPFTL